MTGSARTRILLLEDSDLDAELVQASLARASFEVDVHRVSGRGKYETAIKTGRFDLILADYSLPDYDGLSALRLARATQPDTPFVFVSGVVGEDIATDSLRQGATDYVLKRHLARLPGVVERALAEARERSQRRLAEAALDTSQANTRLAVEAAHLGMWDYQPTQDTFAWDSRCQAMLDIKGEAAGGIARLLARCRPEDREGLQAALEAVVQNRGRLQHEWRTGAEAGDGCTLVMSGEAVLDAHGRPVRVLGMLQDVTEQREAAARQRQNEILFRLAAEAANIAVWDLDIARDELWFDDSLRAMADLPPNAAPSYRDMLRHVIHPDDRLLIERSLAAASHPDGNPEIEYEHRMIGLRDQRVRWIAIKGRRVDGPSGPRLIGTARDITAQRRLHEALREANEALELRVAQRTRERDRIWNLSVDLMNVCRSDGTLAAVNPAWERSLGWSAEEALEAALTDFVHADDKVDTVNQFRLLREGATTVRFDNRLRVRGGSYRWIRWTANVDAGLIYAIGRDVTDERAAADELAATNRELKAQIEERGRVETTLRQMQRLEAVGQLTSGVAHDFNNLLTVVLSNINLIGRLLAQGDNTDPRVLQRLESMRNAAERGAKLTAQLLAFSRRQRLEPDVVDLNHTVLGMRDLLQTTMGGSVELDTDLADALWPALVDPTQIELIILNLAINARDAMDVGGRLLLRTRNIKLTASPSRPEEPEPGEYVAMTVVDTGSGMSEEVLAKAFEPFFTTKAVGRGSGLGLAQVFGFAKQSGGGVRIDTQVGQGTSVHVFLPRAVGYVLADTAKEVAAPSATPRASARHLLMLVDDDAAVREVTASVLEELGYAVLQASSGEHALRLARERRDIELVVADFAMPGMNGADMARALRTLRPELNVLFITGFVDLAALKDVSEDFVLQKPIQDGELAQRLRRLLSSDDLPVQQARTA